MARLAGVDLGIAPRHDPAAITATDHNDGRNDVARAPRFSFPMPADDLLQRIPRDFALAFKVLPVRISGSTMTVVTPDPGNRTMSQELQANLGLRIDARQVSRDEMDEALEFVFGLDAVKAAAQREPPPAATRSQGPASRNGEGPSAAVRVGNTGSHRLPAAGGQSPFDEPPPSGTYHLSGGRTSSVYEGPTARTSLRGSSAGDGPTARNTLGDPRTSGSFSGSRSSSLDDSSSSLPEVRATGRATVSGEASTTPDGQPMIERGSADEEMVGFDAVEDIRALKEDGGRGEAVQTVDRLLSDAIRMGASQVYVDSLDEGFLVRARIGTRLATMAEIDRNRGPEILARLRAMAGIVEASAGGMDSGRITLRKAGGFRVDLFLHTFPGHTAELHVLDVIRFPSAKVQPLAPRGLTDGSPDKLDALLEARLRDGAMAAAIGRLLCGPPTLLVVSSPITRHRESMLALLAGAVGGPSLGRRVVYAGERPRFYLEDQGVILLPTRFTDRHHRYRMAARLSADFLFLEELQGDEDLELALDASSSQCVVAGVAAADPVDLLTRLGESAHNRRVAGRLGATVFLDDESMRVAEITPQLQEALAICDDPSTFRKMFDGTSEEAEAPASQSMEMLARDVFNKAELSS